MDIATAAAAIVMSEYVASEAAVQLGRQVGEIWKKLSEKFTDATIEESANIRFENRLEEITSAEEAYDSISTEQDLHKLSQHLANEVYRVAQEAVRLDETQLNEDVFDFFQKQMKRLLSSTPHKPLSHNQLAGTRAELRLIKLKVFWASSKREAWSQRQVLKEKKKQEELERKQDNNERLKKWVFGLLAGYVLLITLLIVLGRHFWTTNEDIPLVGIPITVVLWSVLGSLASMLYRFYKQTEVEDAEQELRWLLARPLVGIIMGTFVYLVVVSGVVLVGFATSQSNPIEVKQEILWLFAFMGGFSDRFFEALIERVGALAKKEEGLPMNLNDLIEAVELSQDIQGEPGQDANVPIGTEGTAPK